MTNMKRNRSIQIALFTFMIMKCLLCTNGNTTCKKINSCSCSYDDDHIIDLSPLIGNPKWSDQYDPQNVNRYSYNPCNPFSEGTCKDVAVCQYTGVDYYDLGSQESVQFITEEQTGVLSIQYNSTDSLGVTRTSQVVTQCVNNQPDAFDALGETSPGSGYYLYTLSSEHCCPVAKSKSQSSSPILSYGSLVAIGFAGVVAIYLSFGIGIQKYALHKTGLETIPNHDFWVALPGLVRDGVLFVIKCGKGNKTYDQIGAE